MAWDKGNRVCLRVGLLIFEFVLHHSGAFTAVMMAERNEPKLKVKIVIGLICFYSLMLWSFAEALESPAELWIFASRVVSRGISGLINRCEAKHEIMARSALGVVL